ncbi:hypothetical protein FDK21_03045 [Cohaesibacter sp. CAU 1516]|uniref:hypothetical protein n=1 Tax=Cohaesibacter sp. CAU 1516 TaxID=2576038 RepID=UPI0010FD48B1|nr:hypothetical protein [Cohaesibacter sp. CAU 1516]TLP48652.1 hypothetical protein FDK21_03045 [Cohaesibacter sp. CAU 1516]
MNNRDLFSWTGKIAALLQWFLVATLVTAAPYSPAQAQSAAKPLNLGDIIQKSTAGNSAPRSYLKLPETVPVPAAKPAMNQQEAAPGQIAPGTLNSQSTDQNTAQAPNQTPQQAEETPEQQNQSATDPTVLQPMQQQNSPAEPVAPVIDETGVATLQLTALLSEQGEVLQRGVNWRIFAEKRNANGTLQTVQTLDGGTVTVELKTGSYIVYAGYGYANLTKRITLERPGSYSDSFILNAGAVRLNAVASGDIPLDSSILTFDIYTRNDSNGGGQQLVAKNVKPGHVVKMSEGTYHVVSSYGSSNAIVRGDVQIESGKLINVTMIHNAAKVTLRLVSEPGGEALANTIWTVLTPGGDVVKQAIGAFPTLALSAGDYTAIAKQNDAIYNRDFSVDPGLDRDIEVLAEAQ